MLSIFELHLPGYSFCSLGTRLARDEPGINKLDQACRKHEIAYKNFKSIDSRHITEKVLEMNVFDRVVRKRELRV